MTRVDPITVFIENSGTLILDGGLATTLEAHGHVLDGALWSARLLIEAPDAIRAVHDEFLAAGADCIITASYQASLPGFKDAGYSDAEGTELLRRAVRIACDARDAFWAENGSSGRRRPLVAASIGPYGATRSDGSEYDGGYGLSAEDLHGFHQPRWQILAASEADLLACETIPSMQEAEVLLDLLTETLGAKAWLSFSCRDGEHLSDGTPIEEAAARCDGTQGLVAMGINCTAPEYIDDLLAAARRGTDLPLVVYPNAGGRYDAVAQHWAEPVEATDWTAACRRWHAAGARLIGGCCRVGPAVIGSIRSTLT